MVSASPGAADRRLMLVHAHPDDESINNGATMAKYVAEGAEVCLVTCTMGEEGEVLIDELAHLGADADDELGTHRLGELKSAMDALGVTDFVRLGGDFRYRDSGMAWNEARQAIPRDVLRPGIFWTTDLLEASLELVPLIRSRRPQVLITYNEMGNYGHPDHIQAHRVATYGSALAAVPSFRPDLGAPWAVSRLLWITMSASRMRQAVEAMRAAGDTETYAWLDPDRDQLPPMLSADVDIAVEIDGTPWVQQKLAAMRAHGTQIRPDGDFFRSEPVLGSAAWSHEYYRLAAGQPYPGAGWSDDLFAGLA